MRAAAVHRSSAQCLIRLEFAFSDHPLMLLAHAFDSILVITVSVGKLLEDLVEAIGGIAVWIATAKPDPSVQVRIAWAGAASVCRFRERFAWDRPETR
jgi:hypothetical protein